MSDQLWVEHKIALFRGIYADVHEQLGLSNGEQTFLITGRQLYSNLLCTVSQVYVAVPLLLFFQYALPI